MSGRTTRIISFLQAAALRGFQRTEPCMSRLGRLSTYKRSTKRMKQETAKVLRAIPILGQTQVLYWRQKWHQIRAWTALRENEQIYFVFPGVKKQFL